MDKKIYFIGSEELKNNIEMSLQLIGWTIDDFIGWNVDNPILYQLEKIDKLSFHIPDNLLIITNNNMLKNYENTNIFYYQMNNLKFPFSRFFINYIQGLNSKSFDFYDNKEMINLLYFRQTSELEYLETTLQRKNSHIVKKFKYSQYLIEQPIKTIVYMESPEEAIINGNITLTILMGYDRLHKKELKSKNPLAPKLFINKINKSTIKKILRYLN